MSTKPDPKSVPSTVAGAIATDATVVSGGSSATVHRIGRFLLLEQLGVGGMAEVYLAHQEGAAGFQKKVVVKRILPHLAKDKQFVEMFAREAKVAARVSHANVVQIFELGESAGEFFIAMEYLDGLTLHRLAVSSWEQGWAVPVDVVCRTIADAATGLHAAHTLVDETGRALHLVHRDVSPDNLMVSKDGVTKVLDFGIAKGDVGGPKTKTGNLRGKIPFMPPEQITGEVLDGRADLYALGVSMYWMLTGERPFDRQSDWHTMHAILNDAPKPPSAVNPGVPAGLDALILQLVEKSRDKRPATGKEVADRLEELASPGSVGGKKSTTAFLAQLLPAAANRGNPVSEVQPLPAPDPMTGSVPSGEPHGTITAYAAASKLASLDGAPAGATPAPISALEQQPVAAAAPAARPVLPGSVSLNEVGSPASPVPPTPPAPPTPAPPPGPASPAASASAQRGEEAAIKPVTTPAAPNVIADVLAPKPRSGPPVAAIVVLLLVVLAAVVVVAVKVGGQSGGGPVAVVDAGPPPPPPPTQPPPPPPPPTKIDVVAKDAPARVQWLVGDVIVGAGSGTIHVPAGTKALTAKDVRWGSVATVPIEGGVVDYQAVPSGTVQLVRVDDRVTVTLGGDDVSKQRRLRLPVGRYAFVVARGAVKKLVTLDVERDKTITLDGAK